MCANHEGSAGAMKVDGGMRMFNRSVCYRNTPYKNFLEDGDFKTYAEIAKANVYRHLDVRNQECTGHVQTVNSYLSTKTMDF